MVPNLTTILGRMMKNIRLFIPLVIITVITLAVPMAANAGSLVTATLSADAGEFIVGDPVPLTLSVTHPPGYQVILPQLESNWGDFHVHSQSAGTTTSNSDGTETTNQMIDARLFSPGNFTTPPLTITISDESGQLSYISAEPFPVTVTSVLVEGDSELRDIKPQAALPYVNYLPWMVGIGVLVLVLTAAFLWYRRRRAQLAIAAVDNRLPHEVALDELDRVENLDLPKSGRFKEHYTLISDCIRVYMEKTFLFPVLERTTGEIRTELKRTQVGDEVAQKFINLMEDCDLVKFSKFKPDINSAQQIIVTSRHIVEVTKPVALEFEDDDQHPTYNVPPDPVFGENGRNKQAEVTS
jgi:hypothetical protein